jgi:hypothetical protein
VTNLILEKVDNVDNALLYDSVQLLLYLSHYPHVREHIFESRIRNDY